jgi:hypothetical protein
VDIKGEFILKKFYALILITLILIISGCSKGDADEKLASSVRPTSSASPPASTVKEEKKEYHYVYTGENKNWKAVYRVDATAFFTKKDGVLGYENKTEDVFTATYKKKLADLQKGSFLKITYKTPVGGGSSSYSYKDSKIETKTFSQKGSTNGSFVKENDIIKVYVTLDNKTQEFELKNEKSDVK